MSSRLQKFANKRIRRQTAVGSAAFVITRAAGCGIPRIAPVMALSWMNLLVVPAGTERKTYTLDQAVAAFRYLGRAGLIRKVEAWDNAWLDIWEIIEE